MLRCFALCAVLLATPVAAQEEAEGDAAAEAPFTLDNAACPAFLAGIWLANSQQDFGGAIWHVTEALVLNPNGVVELAFAAGVSGDEPEETKTFGTWVAGPGSAKDRCALIIAFEEGERRIVEAAALTATQIRVDGQAFTRAR